jgi:hypothetical protein
MKRRYHGDANSVHFAHDAHLLIPLAPRHSSLPCTSFLPPRKHVLVHFVEQIDVSCGGSY